MGKTSYNLKKIRIVLISFVIIAAGLVCVNLAQAADNMILNPSFEDGTAGDPTNWSSNSWGSNLATFSYPVAGYQGGNAAKISMISYVDGDAKWFFSDVPVTPGEEYTFSSYYISNVETEMDIRYQLSSGGYEYVGVERLPAAATWQQYEYTFTVPSNVVALTFFHIIESIGELTVDEFMLTGDQATTNPNPQLFINANQLLTMQTNGHEIGSHTQTHPDLTTLPTYQAQAEIVGAKNDLLAIGASPVNSFTYPFGEFSLCREFS